MTYLKKIKGKRIYVPTPGNLKDGDIAEITVNRVFVDEAMRRRIGKKTIKI
jgi:hypothetical protein